MRVHPADFYIGPAPTSGSARRFADRLEYISRLGTKPIRRSILKPRVQTGALGKRTDSFGYPKYRPVYTPVSGSNLSTGTMARAAFVRPTTSGTYSLKSQVMVHERNRWSGWERRRGRLA